MIAREWKRIKLDGCEEEFTMKIEFPVDEKGNYAGKDKYGFIAFLRYSDGSNIVFHEKKGASSFLPEQDPCPSSL